MAEREAAGAIILRADGAVLLVKRARPPLAGQWSLPGGRVEARESPEEAVVREVREETGLEVRVVAFVERVHLARERPDGDAFVIHEYLCAPVRDDAPMRAGDDAIDVRWARVQELESLGVSPEARAVVGRARGLAC